MHTMAVAGLITFNANTMYCMLSLSEAIERLSDVDIIADHDSKELFDCTSGRTICTIDATNCVCSLDVEVYATR